MYRRIAIFASPKRSGLFNQKKTASQSAGDSSHSKRQFGSMKNLRERSKSPVSKPKGNFSKANEVKPVFHRPMASYFYDDRTDFSEHSNIAPQKEGFVSQLKTWDSARLRKKLTLETTDFDKVLSNDVYVAEKMLDFLEHGVMIISNVPGDDAKMEAFWAKLDVMCRSYYGAAFTVREVADPLRLTQEEVDSMEELSKFGFPQIDILHCPGEGKGRKVRLCDGMQVAEVLREEDPEVFHTLSTTPFAHTNNGWSDMVQHSPVICLDEENEISSVIFDHHCRSWFYQAPIEEVPKAYRALKTFYDTCYQPRHSLSWKLNPGQMLLCSRKRILCRTERNEENDESEDIKYEGGYINYSSVKDRLQAKIEENYSNTSLIR